MKIKYNHEIISGIVFALISSFLWFSIPTQVKTMEKTAITAQTLPKIAIGGMFVFAVCLLLEGIFMKEKEELTVTKESFHSAAFKKELRSILYCLFLVAYCFMVKPLHRDPGSCDHGVLWCQKMVLLCDPPCHGRHRILCIPSRASRLSAVTGKEEDHGTIFRRFANSVELAELLDYPRRPGYRHRGRSNSRPDL